MKSFALALVLSISAFSSTQIRDTLPVPAVSQGDSGLWSGAVTINCAGDTIGSVRPWAKDLKITNGVVSVDIDPGAASFPSGRPCQVRYTPTAGHGSAWSEIWRVPESGSALRIQDVLSGTTAPVPVITTPTIPWSGVTGAPSFELAANKGAPGGYAALGSDGKVPADQLPSTGGGCGLTATTTWTQLKAGTAPCGSITATTTWTQIKAQ